jgi:hypothetical protein
MNSEVSDLASTEPKGGDVRGEAVVPGARGLLQSIERLVHATNIIGSRGVNKTSQLNVVNCLCQGAMKEGILHIKLMNGLGVRQCHSENHLNSCWLDDRAKSLIIINSPDAV